MIKNKIISEEHKQFMLDVLAKVKYLDYKFHYDSICYPTKEEIEDLKSGKKNSHLLRITIQHYGSDTDPGREDNKSWLSYFANVIITEWSEEAISEAIFVGLIQKLRHEASETFMLGDKFPFHEHKTKPIQIPQ